jgi:hypothetical protein
MHNWSTISQECWVIIGALTSRFCNIDAALFTCDLQLLYCARL